MKAPSPVIPGGVSPVARPARPISSLRTESVRIVIGKFVAVLAMGFALLPSSAGVGAKSVARFGDCLKVARVHTPNICAPMVNLEPLRYLPNVKPVREQVRLHAPAANDHQAVRVAAATIGGRPSPAHGLAPAIKECDFVEETLDRVPEVRSLTHSRIVSSSANGASAKNVLGGA